MTKTTFATAVLAALLMQGLTCEAAFARKAAAAAAKREVTPEERARIVARVLQRPFVQPDSDLSTMVTRKEADGTIHVCGTVHARRSALFVLEEGQRLFIGLFPPGQPGSVSGPVTDGSMEDVYRRMCRTKGLEI